MLDAVHSEEVRDEGPFMSRVLLHAGREREAERREITPKSATVGNSDRIFSSASLRSVSFSGRTISQTLSRI